MNAQGVTPNAVDQEHDELGSDLGGSEYDQDSEYDEDGLYSGSEVNDHDGSYSEGEDVDDDEEEDEENDGPLLEDMSDDGESVVTLHHVFPSPASFTTTTTTTTTTSSSLSSSSFLTSESILPTPPLSPPPPHVARPFDHLTNDAPSILRPHLHSPSSSETLNASLSSSSSLRSFASSETLRSRRSQSLNILKELDLDLDIDLNDIDPLLLKKSLQRSRSVRSSKSSASLRRKKAPKKPPVPLSTILWKICLSLIKFAVFLYKTFLLLIVKVKESPFYQNTVLPFLDRSLYTPLRNKRDQFRAWFLLKLHQLRNLTWQDVKEWYFETREWCIQQYIIFTTPKPKPPPPPPPPPSKPLSEVIAEYKLAIHNSIEAIKKQKWYILSSALVELAVALSKRFGKWVWRQTAPLRTSKFALLVWQSLVWAFVFVGDLWKSLKQTSGFRLVVGKLKSGAKVVVDKAAKVLVSVTPLALIGYSLQISNSKPTLESLALDLHDRIPSTNALEIESEIVWALRTHAGLYIFLTLSFAGVTAWIYLPLLNNMKALQSMNSLEKYKHIMSPYTNSIQKCVTIAILILSLITTVLFHISLLSIEDHVAHIQKQHNWALLNTTLTLIPAAEMSARNLLIQKSLKQALSNQQQHQNTHLRSSSNYRRPISFTTICPLSISVDSTATTASVTCARRLLTSATPCKCPVQEIQSCNLYKSPYTTSSSSSSSSSSSTSSDISMYTIAMHCTNAPTPALKTKLESLKKKSSLKNPLRSTHFQVPVFEAEWIPEPIVVVQSVSVNVARVLAQPVHVGVRFGSVGVKFTRPVFGGGGGGGGKGIVPPQFKATVVGVGDTKVPAWLNEGPFGVLMDSSKPVVNITAGWNTFRVYLNETLLIGSGGGILEGLGPVMIQISPVSCFELQPPNRACDSSVSTVVQIPRVRVSYRVEMVGTLGAPLLVEKDLFSLEIVFDAAVGRLSKRSEIGVVNGLGNGDVSVEFFEKRGGRNSSVAVVGVNEVVEVGRSGPRFRVYRVDIVVPGGLGKEGELRIQVSDGVSGREWPRIPVTEKVGIVEIVRGICCGASSVVFPVLHPSACRSGYQFTNADSCHSGSSSKFKRPIIPIKNNNKNIPSAHPIFDSGAPAFLGAYLSDTISLSFETGLSCPSSSLSLQTFITPSLNKTNPLPGLYTIHQTCAQHKLQNQQTGIDNNMMTRFLHIKESPPSLRILSISRNTNKKPQNNSLHIRFAFSTAIRNTTIPALGGAVLVDHVRDGVVVGPCLVSMDEFDAFDGKEWGIDISIGGGSSGSSGSSTTTISSILGDKESSSSHSSGTTQFLEGDEIRLRIHGSAIKNSKIALNGDMERVKSSGGGGGFFSWIFWGGYASDKQAGGDVGIMGWECVDATPPYSPCLDGESVSVVGDGVKIVGVAYGGSWEQGMTLLRVKFSAPVEARNGAWMPMDIILGVGDKDATAGISIVNIVSVLETMDGNVLNLVVGVSEKQWRDKQGKGAVVHVSVEEGNVVGVVGSGKGRSYVSGNAFSVAVSDFLSSASSSSSKLDSKDPSSSLRNDDLATSSNAWLVGVLVAVLAMGMVFSASIIGVGIVYGGKIDFSQIDYSSF
ncbi:UNVERIFIED_CONTAM: hypothetical protein HDU68_003567 [Siphonaria sp. JEL0065]|nr:hypothetical protein HDU68_003567 [Siphonaria sp. JEL0065]